MTLEAVTNLGLNARNRDRAALSQLGKVGGVRSGEARRQARRALTERVALATIAERRAALQTAVDRLEASKVDPAAKVEAIGRAIDRLNALDRFELLARNG